MTDTIGRRIAQRRKMLSLSQEALGDKLGVSRQAISKWEADAAVPEVDRLIEMSKLFDVSVGWLLGTEPAEAPDETPEEDLSAIITQAFQSPEPEEAPAPTPAPQEPHAPTAPPKNDRWLLPLCAVITACSLVVSVISLTIAMSRPNQTVTAPTPTMDTSALVQQLDQLSLDIAALEREVERQSGSLSKLWDDKFALELRIHDLEQAQNQSTTEPSTPKEDPSDTPQEPASPPISPHIESWSLTGAYDVSLGREILTFQCTATSELTDLTFSAMAQDELLGSSSAEKEGNVYTAQLAIPLKDGCRYYITLDFPDGTSEAVTLKDHGLENLSTGTLVPEMLATLNKTPFGNHTTERFWAGYDVVILNPPPLTGPDTQISWEIDQVIYYYNGEHITYHALNDLLTPEQLNATVLNFKLPTQTFEFPAFQEGDTHELRLYGSIIIDGGHFGFQKTLNVWTVQDGTLVLTS